MARTENKITYTPGEKFSLKDHLFNKQSVGLLTDGLEKALSGFNTKKFTAQAVQGFKDRELRERIILLTDMLEDILSSDFTTACKQIVAALPKPLDPTKTDDDFGQFIYEPYNEYIARHGCTKQNLKIALKTLEQSTQRFSAEFALRAFMKKFETETLAQVTKWSQHKNYHVRRLSSEGIRPSLPWGGKIQTDPQKIVSILNNLYIDHTRYVTRSVANSLNDISKTHLSLVMKTLDRWQKSKKQSPQEMDFIIRHGLRTAIKDGSQEVMDFLGYKSDIKHSIANATIAKEIQIGETQELSFDLVAGETGGFLIDYVMYFNKKNDEQSPKVLKLKDIKLKKGEEVSVVKRYPMREMSTRTLYPGNHAIGIQINGKEVWKEEFVLQK